MPQNQEKKVVIFIDNGVFVWRWWWIFNILHIVYFVSCECVRLFKRFWNIHLRPLDPWREEIGVSFTNCLIHFLLLSEKWKSHRNLLGRCHRLRLHKTLLAKNKEGSLNALLWRLFGGEIIFISRPAKIEKVTAGQHLSRDIVVS